MNSNSKATSRRSKNSRIQAGQTSGALVTDSQHVSATAAVDESNVDGLALIIERLQASKAKLDSDLLDAGRDAGRYWASEVAEYDQLERLEKYCDEHSGFDFGIHLSLCPDAERIFWIIYPDHVGEYEASLLFWELRTQARSMPESPYVEGFAYGALDIWEKVKRKL